MHSQPGQEHYLPNQCPSPRPWRTFSQKFVLHLQFPDFPLQLLQTSPLGNGQVRLVASVRVTIRFHPIAQCLLDHAETARYLGDRPRIVDNFSDRRFLEFR
jgi:hypothetical protein